MLYRDGGFYESSQLMEELLASGDEADFMQDVGELFPAFACNREIDADRLFGSPAFIAELLAHYVWINKVYPRGAATRVVRLRDVYLCRSTLLHISGGEIKTIYETARPNDRAIVEKSEWTPDRLRSSAHKMRQDCPYLYLGSVGWFNYGHWLIDDLPRALAADAMVQHAGASSIEFIVTGFTPELNAVKEQSLRALRFIPGDGRTCFVPDEQPVHFDDIYFVTPVSYHPIVKSPDACSMLRSRGRALSLQSVDLKTAPAKRVYIQRNSAHGREIINREEVSRLFEAFGFTIAGVDGLSFGEQVAVFKDAHIVAGCMGAAMTNSVFCQPGTIVLHLAPEGWMEPFYWDLAGTCGHTYAAMFGPSVNPSGPAHMSAFTIDATRLSVVLTQLLAGIKVGDGHNF